MNFKDEFIQLANVHDRPVFLQPAEIIAIDEGADITNIIIRSGNLFVKESAEEIFQKIDGFDAANKGDKAGE